MQICIWMVLFAIELMKYYLAYHLCYGEKKVRYGIPVLGMGIYFLLLIIGKFYETTVMYLMICPFSALVVAVSVREEQRFSKFLMLFLILNSIDSCISIIFGVWLQTYDYSMLNGDERQLCESLMGILILAFVYCIKRKLNVSIRKKLGSFAKKYIWVVAVMMAICMLITVAELELAREMIIDNKRYYYITLALNVCSCISVAVVIIFAAYVRRINERMEQMVTNEILLNRMQKHYYEELLGKEEDTRRYRHDMKNHLICLKNFAANGDVEKISEYLEEMQEMAAGIQKRCYLTGNEIIDAVTNYYLPQLGEETDVSVFGKIHIMADEMKLCIIYANLLKNAVEELQRGGIEKPYLAIGFYQGWQYARITIENSISGEQTAQGLETILQTKKKDKINHGIGLQNVKKAVEELGGRLELRKNGENFLAEVNLPVEN